MYGTVQVDRDLAGYAVEERSIPKRRKSVAAAIGFALVVSGFWWSTTSKSESLLQNPNAGATNAAGVEETEVEWFAEPARRRAVDQVLSVDFNISVGRVSFSNGASFNSRTINGLFPAETLIVKRGDRLEINLNNQLGPEGIENSTANSFRSPNTTVIHTHGLHISPGGKADNIFRVAKPGDSLQFIYDIPLNHELGTFYVHAHYHGSSALQSAYSMVAALLVVDDFERDRHTEEDFVMIVGLIDIGSGKRTDIITDSKMSKSRLDLDLAGVDVDGGEKLNFLTVNGQINPSLVVIPGTLQRWRVINSVIDGTLRILSDGDCSFAETAADGVQYRSPRLKKASEGVLVSPGSRKDILVYCKSDAQIYSGVDLGMEYDQMLTSYMGHVSKFAHGNLVNVVTPQSEDRVDSMFSLLRTYRFAGPVGYTPEPMSDLRYHDASKTETIEYLQGGPNTTHASRNGNLYSILGINGHVYNSSEVMFRAHLNEKVEWKIVNEKCMDGSPAFESHPFHLHTNHFQIVEMKSAARGGFSPDFAVGDFRDTVLVPAPGSVTIRFVPRDFTGLTVFHCHTLAHEDTGMIANFEILR